MRRRHVVMTVAFLIVMLLAICATFTPGFYGGRWRSTGFNVEFKQGEALSYRGVVHQAEGALTIGSTEQKGISWAAWKIEIWMYPFIREQMSRARVFIDVEGPLPISRLVTSRLTIRLNDFLLFEETLSSPYAEKPGYYTLSEDAPRIPDIYGYPRAIYYVGPSSRFSASPKMLQPKENVVNITLSGLATWSIYSTVITLELRYDQEAWRSYSSFIPALFVTEVVVVFLVAARFLRFIDSIAERPVEPLEVKGGSRQDREIAEANGVVSRSASPDKSAQEMLRK